MPTQYCYQHVPVPAQYCYQHAPLLHNNVISMSLCRTIPLSACPFARTILLSACPFAAQYRYQHAPLPHNTVISMSLFCRNVSLRRGGQVMLITNTPHSVKFKNDLAIPPLPLYAFMVSKQNIALTTSLKACL